MDDSKKELTGELYTVEMRNSGNMPKAGMLIRVLVPSDTNPSWHEAIVNYWGEFSAVVTTKYVKERKLSLGDLRDFDYKPIQLKKISLPDYLVSDDYIDHLESVVLARISPSIGKESKHRVVLDMIREFKAQRNEMQDAPIVADEISDSMMLDWMIINHTNIVLSRGKYIIEWYDDNLNRHTTKGYSDARCAIESAMSVI